MDPDELWRSQVLARNDTLIELWEDLGDAEDREAEGLEPPSPGWRGRLMWRYLFMRLMGMLPLRVPPPAVT